MAHKLDLFLTLALLPILSPGPAVLLTISNTIEHGPKGGLISASANAIGVILTGAIVGLSLGTFVTFGPDTLLSIQALSALYLLYLGLEMFARSSDRLLQKARQRKLPAGILFRGAFLLGIANPAGVAFFAATIPLFIDASSPIAPQALIMVISYALTLIVYHVYVVWFSGMLRHRIEKTNTFVALRRAAGALFIGLSFYIIMRASIVAFV